MNEEITSEQAQMDKAIAYKQLFLGKEQGQTVMLDLMNRFYLSKPFPRENIHEHSTIEKAQRAVVEYIFMQANIDIAKLSKLLKGESVYE